MRFNPPCRTSAERLLAKGKQRILVLGAIMTKLLHLIYSVLKSGRPFNPNHLAKPKAA